MFSAIKKVITQYFDFIPSNIKKLNGYDNENYLIENGTTKYIFKTYVYESSAFDQLIAENEILIYLYNTDNVKYPQPIANANGETLKKVTLDGKTKIIRMLSFLEGTMYGDVGSSPGLLQSFGHFLATMDLTLMKANNYTIKARNFNWDNANLHLNRPYIESIENPADRKVVEYFFMQFEHHIKPVLPRLRKSIIHSDANEWNVLVNQNKVTGIIDFGDLVYSPLVNELSIALAYALMYMIDEGIEATTPLVKAYHDVLPLKETEIDILYYLIAARLCTSVCNSAYSSKQSPENEYISISAKSAWKTLHYLITLNPVFVKNIFRKALDLPI